MANQPATGHGTRDTERPAGTHTAQQPAESVPPSHLTGLAVRDAAYRTPRDTGHGTRTAPVPSPAPNGTSRAANGTRDTRHDSERDTRPGLLSRIAARYAASRTARARTAEHQKELQAASRAARDATEQAVRDAAARTAAERKRASRTGQQDVPRAEDIAPIPNGMRKFGIWAERTIGELPLASPLIVSGYFTFKVFHDAPLSAPWAIALLVTLGLEGGLWKLVRIRHRMLIDGYSVIGLTAGIGAYLAFISSLIFGHAYYLAWEASRKAAGADITAADVAIDWKAWGPAAGVAVISAFGVFISSKDARYKARVEMARQELLDKRAAKFAVASWFWTPWETFWAFRHSIKYRIQSPVLAVDDWRLWKITGRPALWPAPEGFRYVDGNLVADERDTGHGTRDTVGGTPVQRTVRDNGTLNGTLNGTPSRSVPLAATEHHGTRDTTNATGHHGTPPARPDTTPDAQHGTRDSNGTQDTPRDTLDALADDLRYAEHLLVVTETFKNWQTRTPAVRAIRDAIHASRMATDGGSFRSMDVASSVQKALVRLRDRPELLDAMKVETDTLANPSANTGR